MSLAQHRGCLVDEHWTPSPVVEGPSLAPFETLTILVSRAHHGTRAPVGQGQERKVRSAKACFDHGETLDIAV